MEILIGSPQSKPKDFGIINNGNYPAYIAGPITGYKQKNWPAFLEVENLIGMQWCLTPHRLNDLIHLNEILPDEQLSQSETTYFRKSVNALLNRAHSIVLLRHWDRSKGAIAEFALAQRLGLPIFQVEYEAGLGTYSGTRPIGLVEYR